MIAPPVLALLLAITEPAPKTEAPLPAPAADAPAGVTPSPAPDAAPPGEDDDQSTGPLAPIPPPPGPAPSDQPGQSGPTPYSDADAKAYSDAVLAAAHAAEALQGPLDGGWTLTDARGRPLYGFRVVDRGRGMGLVEGAWRDLAAGEGPATSGFIDTVGYDGSKLMFRFYEAGPDDLVVLTLEPSAAKAWRGELWRRGAVTRVTFRKEGA